MRLEIDLAVGDVIQIGDHYLTVVEAHPPEVTFKIMNAIDLEPSDDFPPPRPR